MVNCTVCGSRTYALPHGVEGLTASALSNNEWNLFWGASLLLSYSNGRCSTDANLFITHYGQDSPFCIILALLRCFARDKEDEGHGFNPRFTNGAKNTSPLLFKSVKEACSAAHPLMEKVLEACLLIAEATIYSQQHCSLLQVICASKRYLS